VDLDLQYLDANQPLKLYAFRAAQQVELRLAPITVDVFHANRNSNQMNALVGPVSMRVDRHSEFVFNVRRFKQAVKSLNPDDEYTFALIEQLPKDKFRALWINANTSPEMNHLVTGSRLLLWPLSIFETKSAESLKEPLIAGNVKMTKQENLGAAHKRFVLVKFNIMFYFEHNKSKEPKGVVNLEHYMLSPIEQPKKKLYVFRLEKVALSFAPRPKLYQFTFDDLALAQQWHRALIGECANRMAGTKLPPPRIEIDEVKLPPLLKKLPPPLDVPTNFPVENIDAPSTPYVPPTIGSNADNSMMAPQGDRASVMMNPTPGAAAGAPPPVSSGGPPPPPHMSTAAGPPPPLLSTGVGAPPVGGGFGAGGPGELLRSPMRMHPGGPPGGPQPPGADVAARAMPPPAGRPGPGAGAPMRRDGAPPGARPGPGPMPMGGFPPPIGAGGGPPPMAERPPIGAGAPPPGAPSPASFAAPGAVPPPLSGGPAPGPGGMPPPLAGGPGGMPPPLAGGPSGMPPPLAGGPGGMPPPMAGGPGGMPPPMGGPGSAPPIARRARAAGTPPGSFRAPMRAGPPGGLGGAPPPSRGMMNVSGEIPPPPSPGGDEHNTSSGSLPDVAASSGSPSPQPNGTPPGSFHIPPPMSKSPPPMATSAPPPTAPRVGGSMTYSPRNGRRPDSVSMSPIARRGAATLQPRGGLGMAPPPAVGVAPAPMRAMPPGSPMGGPPGRGPGRAAPFSSSADLPPPAAAPSPIDEYAAFGGAFAAAIGGGGGGGPGPGPGRFMGAPGLPPPMGGGAPDQYGALPAPLTNAAPAALEIVYALYDYEAPGLLTEDGEGAISIRKGEKLMISERRGDGWLKGSNGAGDVGLIPGHFTQSTPV
jgi:hypothetical protein